MAAATQTEKRVERYKDKAQKHQVKNRTKRTFPLETTDIRTSTQPFIKQTRSRKQRTKRTKTKKQNTKHEPQNKTKQNRTKTSYKKDVKIKKLLRKTFIYEYQRQCFHS